MKKTLFLTVAAVMCFVFFSAVEAFADGLMVTYLPYHIIGPLGPQVEVLPVKYHRVTVTINNGVATTSVDQVFKNEYDVDVEGTYMFPIPEDAAITNFSIYVDGKKVSAEVLDKAQARRAYEDLVSRMRDPGLLEYAGRNMFRARVYPIPKHGEKRVELTYQQTINYDNGIYTYIYPLDTERFSPKPLEEVVISTKIKSNIPIKSVYSPSHEIQTDIEKLEASCSYEAKDVLPDKNFILHYTVSEKDVGLNLLCYRKANEDGYFVLFLSPGQLEEKAIDKDVVFVLDTSGSMSGEKIEQAKNALRFCVNSLSAGDRFNLITFAGTIEHYKEALIPADKDNIKQALEFIGNVRANGGTNINEALLTALKDFTDDRRPRMLVFLTDGEPTVGVTDAKEILKNISEANTNKTRLFVFGVGEDVNTYFLDKASEVNRGTSEYVLPEENIETKVSSFFKKVGDPVMSDIRLDYGVVRTKEVYPPTLPDIFNGAQVIIMGRYENEGNAKITLKGYVQGKEKELAYEGSFPAETKENDFIPRLWATRKIGYLLSQMRFKEENKELVDEIVRLSKEFGIITPYTSFFIAEEERKLAGDSFGSRGYEPDYLFESSVSVDSLGLSKGMGGYQLAQTGHKGLLGAQAIADSKGAIKMEAPASKGVKYRGDKVFYLRRDGYWADSVYVEGAKVQDIKYLSPEYLELIKKKPGIARYLALDRKVIVVFEGKCYRIVE